MAIKAHVKTVDMSEEMEKDAIEISREALFEYNVESQMAAHIKREFDKKYSPTWHVVIGTNYGSHVVHATKHFIYFYLGPKAILLFKSG
mmetsp:Transcript_44736/g.95163  ORF Transcript_44736/g.95163 Transcript_44736/m.95163 type:complete len:89 (-) Transcript_44736:285-551(-)|eukprot:CAMPEP_0183355470 /NCGR_PEP_ID=MMETSP0164_2-20130417/40523_1 /TAXON_ID=221442 /ORGANISM="Coccolithus pelagicus ssp braarudi, Strain PLY182g" /LENGTH=88 /DNA_ID=CAMNT_0025528593 /DNA_START=89 /DNA_END=355 /DNA_ORIENTATION=-